MQPAVPIMVNTESAVFALKIVLIVYPQSYGQIIETAVAAPSAAVKAKPTPMAGIFW